MNALLLTLALTFQATDAHTPSHVVDGQKVIFDAEIAWVDSAPPGATYTLTRGTRGPGPGEFLGMNSGNVHGSLEWALDPGEYTFTMMGHADDLSQPNRQVLQVTFTVSGPSRSDEILAHVIAYLTARRNLTIMNPPPTEAEMLSAVIEALTNRGL